MKSIKKPISILLSLILILGVFTIIPVVTAGALDGIGYLDEDGEEQTANGVTAITSGSTALNAGWYAVTADTEINSRITCTGDVNLILCNDTTLTAHKGITVSGEDNSLTIYQQAEAENAETGKLIIDQVDDDNAGIGGDSADADCGIITVNGGIVTAAGGSLSAGIGTGYDSNVNFNHDAGTVIINGGTVNATGGENGAGIGGGLNSSGGNVTVNSGTVNAIGGVNAAGIGSGTRVVISGPFGISYGSNINVTGGNVTINGGTVNATGGQSGAGIGGGMGVSGGTVIINDGSVTAKGGNTGGSDSRGSGGAGIGGGTSYTGMSGDEHYGNGGTVIISGGTVTATGGIVDEIGSERAAGIGGGYQGSGGETTLSRTNPSDSIYANSYDGTVTLEKDFYAYLTHIPAGVLTDNGVIANKTLVPPATYIDEEGVEHTTGYIPVTSDTTSLSDGWYAVTADTEISDRIICDKDVYLILFDGATLTAPEGIAVNENNYLTIYGQAIGDGTLLITGSGSDSNAGIGGDQGCRSGVITINSGTVNVNIDNIHCLAAAIGGGEDGDGSVFINGGTVSASTPPGLGAAIGGAHKCSGFVEINGGNVTASSVGGGAYSIENHKISSVRLSWTNLSDSIKANSYIGNVTLLEDFRADAALISAGGLSDNSVIEGKTLTPPGFIGHSLTLSGDIGINYFMLLSDEEIESGAVVDFTWTVDDVEKTASVTLTADDKTENGYRATCPVAVAEMTYDVTATLTVDGEELATDTYSVKQYADTILSNVYKTRYIADNHTEEDYIKLAALIKTMLDYGAKAQVVFKRNTGNLANIGVDYRMTIPDPDTIPSAASDMDSGLDAYGLEYGGTTIVYLTKTSLRHYYTVTDQTKFDAVKDDITFDGEKVDYQTKDGNIYFELINIAAADLDTPYILTIGMTDYQYAVLDYVRECMNSDDVPRSTFNLVCATYWYSQAANAYFGR